MGSKEDVIVVTGGAGFIGSHLIDRLLERGERVLCLDDFNDFYDATIKRRNVKRHLESNHYKLIEGDIRDEKLLSDVFTTFQVTKIVH